MITDDTGIKSILTSAKTIAVVGASPKPWRDSGSIAQFLSEKHYTVYPVNPKYQEVLGMKCYPDLTALPEKIDIVDIFRASSEVELVVDEAILVGAKCVWMQLGVVNERAAAKAESAGITVIMDRCIAIEYRALMR
ncbi:MAG TPA: CoA-binding protein [Bacteroidota bacterium]|nr:CoA-binding protein [Bacteroidota bacterium]